MTTLALKVYNVANRPVILDFDQSVGRIHNALHLNLQAWQERIRFGCSKKQFLALETDLNKQLPAPPQISTVMLGSGDYHHISLLLLKRLHAYVKPTQPIDVVIFDNHPDNMRYIFGIHCGSWVSCVTRLPFVRHVHVVGITSNDIGLSHAWENRLMPLWRGKLFYWSMNVDVQWSKKIGLQHAFLQFNSADELIDRFTQEQLNETCPVYLSIDKDALSEDVVKTNWDQGLLKLEHVTQVISCLKGRILGSDITGEISYYHYRSALKRFLSACDQQTSILPEMIKVYQEAQHQANLSLIERIQESHY